MVLNDKILARKELAMLHILDQDGGCSVIEAFGILHWLEIKVEERFRAQQQARKGGPPPQDYDKLKARRLSEVQGS